MNYSDTITRVQDLLVKDREWINRYKGYSETIESRNAKITDTNMTIFQKAQKQFAVPAPFQLYMPLSTAVNECSKNRTVFELRFHGQSVAKLYVDNKKSKFVEVHIKKSQAVIKVLLELGLTDYANAFEAIWDNRFAWSSDFSKECKEAKLFRKIYSELEYSLGQNPQIKLKGQPEHEMESAILENFLQKSTMQKEIPYIQPVVMSGTRARFQMPTPIMASNAKNGADKIKYSSHSGGGIDILARVGSGYNTTLAIMELKDKNDKNEPPETAINQAIAYATFIRELLRSECGKDWWGFFGFGGYLPNILELKAVIVMPNENNPSKDFADESVRYLHFDGSKDFIKLGYIYRATGISDLEYNF